MDFYFADGKYYERPRERTCTECDMDYRRITYNSSLNIGLSMKRPPILQWSRELNTLKKKKKHKQVTKTSKALQIQTTQNRKAW